MSTPPTEGTGFGAKVGGKAGFVVGEFVFRKAELSGRCSIFVLQSEPCVLQQLVQQLHLTLGNSPWQSATNSKKAILLSQKAVSKDPAKSFPLR